MNYTVYLRILLEKLELTGLRSAMIAVALLALFMMGLCVAFGVYTVRLPRYTFKRLALVIHLFAGLLIHIQYSIYSIVQYLQYCSSPFQLTKTGNCRLSAH